MSGLSIADKINPVFDYLGEMEARNQSARSVTVKLIGILAGVVLIAAGFFIFFGGEMG